MYILVQVLNVAYICNYIYTYLILNVDIYPGGRGRGDGGGGGGGGGQVPFLVLPTPLYLPTVQSRN